MGDLAVIHALLTTVWKTVQSVLLYFIDFSFYVSPQTLNPRRTINSVHDIHGYFETSLQIRDGLDTEA